MKFVQLLDVRANIDSLLAEVERGETLIITRGGMPARPRRRSDVDGWRRWCTAMRDLTDLKKGAGIVSIEELLRWREEARKSATARKGRASGSSSWLG